MTEFEFSSIGTETSQSLSPGAEPGLVFVSGARVFSPKHAPADDANNED
jgi:hypothetical protein